MKRWMAGLAAGLLVLGWGAGTVQAGQHPKVKVAMDWIVGGRHAPWFVALEKGYYAEEGLDVEVLRGFGSASTVQRVVAGDVQVAYSDFPTSILARAEGGKVKTVAMVLGRNPETFFSLKKTGITRPKDLEGRTVVSNAGSAAPKLFPIFAELHRIDQSKVKWVMVEPAAKGSMLIAGSTDVAQYFLMQQPLLERDSARLGGINTMLWADHGFQLYSNAMIVTDDYLGKNGDVVRRFLRATIRGFHRTFENPEEAEALLRKSHPTLDPAVTRAEVEILKKLVLTEDARAHGIGWMDEAKVRAARDIMARAYGLKSPVQTADLYTNDFLPKK
jgi:NitT/TauT family transport system substrate-binding protein